MPAVTGKTGLEKPLLKINLWDYAGDSPPPFGHPMHEFFSFDPHYVNLNHGAFGSVPTPVQRYVTVLSDQIERNPDKFVRLEYTRMLLRVRQRLSTLIGAHTNEVVLAPNATSAANTVLRNFDWQEGDVIIGATTTYGNVSKTIQHVHDTHRGVTLSPFLLTFPSTHAQILQAFRAHIHSVRQSAGIGTKSASLRKVVCVLDSIVSNPGILLPWKEMVHICTEENVWSVVDAAHSIGQEPDISMANVQPDFWFSNCHKWLYAKRACAVLYVPRRNQYIIKSSIPTSQLYISPEEPVLPLDWMKKAFASSQDRTNGEGSEEDDRWATQFAWTGTLDLTPFLSVDAALDFREFLGGEQVIIDYCHQLAVKGGKHLAEMLGTSILDQSENAEETACMTNIFLPLPVVSATDMKKIGYVQDTLRDRLLLDHSAYAAHYYHNGKFLLRCSAQIFNEISDFEVLGKAVIAVCEEMSPTLASGST